MRYSPFFILAFVIVLTSVSVNAIEAKLEIIPTPAPMNSRLSRIVADEAGQIYLSWVASEANVTHFAYAKLTENGWSAPETLSEGNNWFLNWADFPGLSVNKGHIAAYWLQKSAKGAYEYDIRARFYNARKRNWSDDRIIHTDGVKAEHGFVSQLPMASGRTLISWLDGRETKKETGTMTLRGGIFDPSGTALKEWELDPRVCSCCQTSSAMTALGPIVVYRDRSDNEIRDIYKTRYVNGKWEQPRPIHNDNWQIAGCPVNGPAISAKGKQVAVSWFTARDDTPKVQLSLSNDNGDSFSAPVVVASPNTNGRVGTVILSSRKIVVSWMDTTQEEARIVLSLFEPDGSFIRNSTVTTTNASRRSGFPIVQGVDNSVYVTWTDISAGSQVKIARVNYE